MDVLMHRVEKVLNCNMPEDEASLSGGGKNTNPLGDKAAHSNDSSQNVDCSTVLCVKTIHISSFILAAKSPFFYKLFSNGMRESEQRHVTLRIHASDTAAVQPLKEAAKEFLVARYKDMTKFQEEVLNFPLVGIEAVLSSDDLQVASEDAVYDFLLKWARTHYPKLEERREVLGTHIGRLIRFPYMTCRKLRKVRTCNDFDPELASKVVFEALFFKAEAPYWQHSLAADEANASGRRFVERAYKYHLVKVVEFELPRQQCVVYLDLKREECAHLFPSGRLYSQAFHLGEQGFFLSARCNMDQQSSFRCFGFFLGIIEEGAVTVAVDYEFAARSKPTEEYRCKCKGNRTFTGGQFVGYRNLFSLPWTAFMADESCYNFINEILDLQAVLTIKQ
ncbi:unnamed protein product [Camellia sinensis]